MHELISVVEETHKFFQLLAEDVHIDVNRGEWHASNFDPESLNFTAEFDGPASAEQIRAFGSAFGGSTSLRRNTIAQFTRIADFIEDDELVGFGLYQSDQENEPSDWRCLSRVDALRFADEIQFLAKGPGDSGLDAPLPPVMNGSVGGRRLFKDRREREALASDPSKWIREVESSLSRRIALLEGELATQTRKIHILENAPDAEEKFLKMLGAMESYRAYSPQLLALGPAEPVGQGFAGFNDRHEEAAESSAEFAPRRASSRSSRLGWGLGLALAAGALILTAVRSSNIQTQFGVPRRAQLASLAPSAPYRALLPTPPDLQKLNASTQVAEPTQPRAHGPVDSDSVQTRRDTAPEFVNEVALEIPPEQRLRVGSDVTVNVSVDVDRAGKVTTAQVASTKGEGADALAPEALKAARGFHFRPARRGKKNVPSQTVLTFKFTPDSHAWLTEGTHPEINPAPLP
ncbi:MAG: TonB family protein [Acidobacteriota bacterium]